ncbi:MAG: Rha family transcriptional regulator, partial [Ruminococcus sp.]|nr:Rha family transcriptional regulator [Ruminococcus sp.]
MNELTLINFNGIETIDSRQVAEAVEKDHNKLLRDIRTYCEYLGESKIGHSDFFIKSTYITEQNKKMP